MLDVARAHGFLFDSLTYTGRMLLPAKRPHLDGIWQSRTVNATDEVIRASDRLVIAF
jgi:hypothetical protein